jgi:flagellar protein FlaI
MASTARTTLPFDVEKTVHVRDDPDNLLAALSESLQEVCRQNDFIYDYLLCLPVDKIGIPDYYPRLSRSLRDLDRYNLVYPIKAGLFVHIYPDSSGARDKYIAIEPHLTADVGDLMEEVELGLLDFVEEIGLADTPEKKREALLKALDDILTTNGRSHA